MGNTALTPSAEAKIKGTKFENIEINEDTQ